MRLNRFPQFTNVVSEWISHCQSGIWYNSYAGAVAGDLRIFLIGPTTSTLGRFVYCSASRVWFEGGAGSTFFDVYPTDLPDAGGRRNWEASATGGLGNNRVTATCF